MDALVDRIIIPGLTFLSITSIGVSILLSKLRKRKTLETRMREDAWTETDTIASSEKKSGLLQFLEKVGNIASHGKASTNLWEQLFRAGYFSKAAPAMYTGIKMLLFIIGIVGAAVLAIPMKYNIITKINIIFLGGVFLFFIPNIILSIRLKKRHDEINRHLPEAIDLLEICVSSGIGLGMAWNIVADEIKNVSSILAGAMALTNFEIHLGVSRVEAMRHMAERTGVEKLSSLAAIMVQTERFGTSVATALQVFAESMREERFFEVEEHAEKIAAKLIVPMVLFIFPAIFIVTVGPAILIIVQTMGSF